MKLHERERIALQANLDIKKAILDAEIKYDLTFGEIYQILACTMNDYAKCQIREERHGDQSIPGGLAKE